MPYVYLLRCRDNSLYAGIAKDLSRRLAEHARGRASRYTRARLPVTLAWSRRVRTWRGALREERRIKTLSRPQKDALVHDALPGAHRARHERGAPRRSGANVSVRPRGSLSTPHREAGETL